MSPLDPSATPSQHLIAVPVKELLLLCKGRTDRLSAASVVALVEATVNPAAVRELLGPIAQRAGNHALLWALAALTTALLTGYAVIGGWARPLMWALGLLAVVLLAFASRAAGSQAAAELALSSVQRLPDKGPLSRETFGRLTVQLENHPRFALSGYSKPLFFAHLYLLHALVKEQRTRR